MSESSTAGADSPPSIVTPLAEIKTTPPRIARRRNRRLRAAGIVAWAAFTALTIIVRLLRPETWDLRITRLVQSIRSRPFRALMWLISEPGFAPQTSLIPVGVAALLAWVGWRREAAFALATFPAQWLVVFIKLFLQRARPAGTSVTVSRVLRDTSFPSGHTVHYVTFYGYLWYLAFVRLDTCFPRRVVLTITGSLVTLVGPSRIYLGHHWASDVLGGYALGFGLLVTMIDGYRQGAWPLTWRWLMRIGRVARWRIRRLSRLVDRTGEAAGGQPAGGATASSKFGTGPNALTGQ